MHYSAWVYELKTHSLSFQEDGICAALSQLNQSLTPLSWSLPTGWCFNDYPFEYH